MSKPIQMQMVELLFTTPPTVDAHAIKSRAQEILLSEIDSSDPAKANSVLLLFHKEHQQNYKDGKLPGQTALMGTDKAPQAEDYLESIQQSWKCPNAEELIRGCRASHLVTEMMSGLLSPAIRFALFHGVLQAAVEVMQPQALVFMHSQQVIASDNYLQSCTATDDLQRAGALNVRFFNISNSPGDMIMDTYGMEAIGLHDLQCHYRELDPKDVAGVLYNSAFYLFQNGAVIQSGETIEGVQPGSKWRCQFENSMLNPDRELLDLNPGSPFAAGGRSS